ncbi:MAG TPA: nuclear transport factor 2 family protein [Longimicrobiaceae bacterium]
MHRTLGIALSATMLLAACKIERTPRQFYSQRDPAAAERELFAAELTDRVAAMGPALDRGDLGAAVFALSPAPDVYVIGPGGGVPATGPDGLTRMLRSVRDSVPAAVRVDGVRVAFGPRAQTAWVAAGVEVVPAGDVAAGAGPDTLRFTGVYQRSRGEWLLMQAHLSRRFTPPAPPAPAPSPADSARPAAAARDSAPPT